MPRNREKLSEATIKVYLLTHHTSQTSTRNLHNPRFGPVFEHLLYLRDFLPLRPFISNVVYT